ncbi:MAG: 50S ribosomal protein L10 [Thermoplasmata archaeon]|nr:50S ribosomal protein L10 [Thermoplasmata archaeon]
MAHVAAWKKDIVQELKDLVGSYKTVAIVRVDDIPGIQLMQMRAKLRDRMRFKVAKKSLIRIALEDLKGEKEGIDELSNTVDGQAAVLGTDLNPFTLFKILKDNMQPMAAKGGEKAPFDIVVPAGETSFPPGPIVGEFGKAGIPAAIVKGKVVIKKDITPVKQGGVISRDLAQMLAKLEILPFNAGIQLGGAWEDGQFYVPTDLDIDMDAYRQNLTVATQMAFNLAVYTAYMTPQTAVPLLAKARSEALNLAVYAGIMNDDSKELILSKAYGNMLALAGLMTAEANDDDLKALLGSATAASAAAPVEEAAAPAEAAPPKEEEEEAPSEEEAAAGLGALFG